ncbi:MAG: hypothetical protein VW270_02115 [Candidatus Poseidoniales archaeon]|jgi:hypothetical protein
MTEETEMYVAIKKIQKWKQQGFSDKEIARLWNSGTPTPKKGINKHGVAYDTEAYARAVIANL